MLNCYLEQDFKLCRQVSNKISKARQSNVIPQWSTAKYTTVEYSKVSLTAKQGINTIAELRKVYHGRAVQSIYHSRTEQLCHRKEA